MKADKLASFRVDSQLWEQFQGYAKENNNTASALLVGYIKSVVNPDNVNTSSEVVNTPSDHLSIHDIDSRIDEKIRQSIQDINTPSIQNIDELIDSRIGGSVREGDIKSAIAHSYQSSVDQFNEMIGELQNQIRELQKQFEELSVSPPSAPVPPSAIDSPPAELEIPHNKQQIIRAALSKKNIKVSSAQIRKAFYDAGWDGNNFDSIRKDILEILLGGE
jgi:hypothetical protein